MRFTTRVSVALSSAFIVGSVLISTSCSDPAGLNTKDRGMVQLQLSSSGSVSAASIRRSPGSPTAALATGLPGQGMASASPAGHDGGLPFVTSAIVTLSDISARTTDGLLVPVEIALPTTFDLLALAEGQPISLPVGFLPPGTYDQLVVVVTGVEIVLVDGTLVQITPPGGSWNLVVSTGFEVIEGESTTVELDFCGNVTFLDGEFRFDPKFGCGNGDGDETDQGGDDEGED